jgi:hypothetical protein
MTDVIKKYSRMGKRWSEEEDEDLKQRYEKFHSDNSNNLEESFGPFLQELCNLFQRAPGGMKARLARYFLDVPGWDYALAQKRDEEYLKMRAQRDAAKQSKDDIATNNSKQSSKYSEPEEEIIQPDFSDNLEAQEALKILTDTNDNLFLTGEAGTGKSTLLNYFRATTEKNVVVLAPTGVAALNVEGQTIHSFCAFGPDITLQKVKKLNPDSPKSKLLQKLQTVVIDEISMVRADLLDCMDKFLRLNGPSSNSPFGGSQMIFIGDLYQLPPVDKDFDTGSLIKKYNSPYFFESLAFKSSAFRHVQLKTIYRQKDGVFIDVLNAVRNNVATQEHLTILNERVEDAPSEFTFEKFAIYLTPHNASARRVNNYFLGRLSPELKTYHGRASGTFENRELPTDLELQIKVGAQVMMLNNDRRKRWVNGTMGKILSLNPVSENLEGLTGSENSENIENQYVYENDEIENNFIGANHLPSSNPISVELETGEIVLVSPHTWEMFRFTLDKRTQKVDSKTTGTFTQYPFKLAWAVTIHKAQGKTFDKVYIDLSIGTFAHGQLYVALSRCRTLGGLHLKRAIEPSDIILDRRIVDFLESLKTKT